MIFGSVPLDDAEGAILAHSQLIGGRRLPKGRELTAADIAAARADGFATLVVVRLEPDDVPEDAAAGRLAAALAGAGLVADPPVHGRANISAATSGLLCLDPAAVQALNAIDEAITLGTLDRYAHVTAGEIVATIKIIPYAVHNDHLAQAITAAIGARLSVAPLRPAMVDLIQTRLPGQPDKLFAKTSEVTRGRLTALGATLAHDSQCPHVPEALAALLARPTAAALTLVAGASATVDRRDVVPAAIEAAGGRVERLGMPVDPGNLLCLGFIGERPVLGLPGCARSPKRNGFDWVLERLLAGLSVDSAAIAAMGVGGLLPETERPEPRLSPEAHAPARICAIVLAAGRSTRMHGINKLLADLGGRPIVAHVVDAIAAAGLPAPVIVLGNMADAVRAAVESRPASFVRAPDFADGLSRSLRAGIAALPADCDAAIVCLGDMPGVMPAVIESLASTYRTPSDIVVPSWRGKRGNPILWGRAYFPRLMALEGDVGGKALLAEFSEHVIELPVDTEAVLADIDTPEALESARRSTL